jgi:hypothetical protein
MNVDDIKKILDVAYFSILDENNLKLESTYGMIKYRTRILELLEKIEETEPTKPTKKSEDKGNVTKSAITTTVDIFNKTTEDFKSILKTGKL